MLSVIIAPLIIGGLPRGYPSTPVRGVSGSVDMPMIGLGPWLYNASVARAAVASALTLGYRHVDTALGYENQVGVGQALASSGLLREEYFLPADELQKLLSAQNMLNESRTLIYCGGGIAATLDGFACMLLGQQNVGVYDGSMSEWASDPDRPLKLGATP